jgi:predicted peptidase
MKSTTAAALAALVALAPAARAEDDMAKKTGAFEKRTFIDPSGKKLLYRLLKPEGYDPAGKDVYPLVIFLHGAGERGDDNEAQLKHGAREFATPENRKKHPCFVVAPQCPKDKSWANIERKGTNLAVLSGKAPSEPMALVLQLMDALPGEFRIDPKRVYVTGLSMGGFGTWDVLARRSERVAAAVPVCGGGLAEAVPSFAKVPIWVFHGAVDPVVKPQMSRQMVEALWKAGAHPGYTEYPGVAHDSWTMTYHDPDVLAWLFKQKKKD